MKKTIFISFLLISGIAAKSFTVTDPPMIYIYHFVSYDTTSILIHDSQGNEVKDKIIKFPLFNKNDISLHQSDIIVGKPLDPKLVSSMVTSAVALNKHINIAGESIQDRMKTDDFLKLVKSYEYPERTDFIFIGEINTVSMQYEIDLKLIDVSTQKIVASNSFNLPFESMTDLRNRINGIVAPIMHKIITPFIGFVYLRADSTSIDKIRWDDISIRPLETVVGSDLTNTANSDLEPYVSINMPDRFLDTHGKILGQYSPRQYRLVSDMNGEATFLAGEYRFRAFLKNNELPFETDFVVLPGDLNEIYISLPNTYIPPPKDTDGDGILDINDACPDLVGIKSNNTEINGCPPPILIGNITITNVWDGVAFELFDLSEEKEELILFGFRDGDFLDITSNQFKYSYNDKNNSITIYNLPLGRYLRKSWAYPEETFPGKHYVHMFTDIHYLDLEENGANINTVINNLDKKQGREVVIYFNPFTPFEDDVYRLYWKNNIFQFTALKVVGELHIVGFPTDYSGYLRVERDGHEDAIINIKTGNKKTYHIADLSKPISSGIKKKRPW